jgi:hypothetical protein
MPFEQQPKSEIDPAESRMGREIEETEEAMMEAIAMLDRSNRQLLELWAKRQDLVKSGADAEEEKRLLRELEFFVSDLTDAAKALEGRYEELRRVRADYLERKRDDECP